MKNEGMTVDRMTISTQKMRLERLIRMAQGAEQQARELRRELEGELWSLQRKCPHERVVEKDEPWQGGGKYYVYTKCHDCGKEGDRYLPLLTRSKTRERSELWGTSDPGEAYFEKLDASERENLVNGKWW